MNPMGSPDRESMQIKCVENSTTAYSPPRDQHMSDTRNLIFLLPGSSGTLSFVVTKLTGRMITPNISRSKEKGYRPQSTGRRRTAVRNRLARS